MTQNINGVHTNIDCTKSHNKLLEHLHNQYDEVSVVNSTTDKNKKIILAK